MAGPHSVGGGGLTELLVSLGRDLQDNPLDQELQVAEEDERWRGRGPAVVLLNQVMALELPDLVCVFLHLLERVAGGRQRCVCQKDCGTQHSRAKCLVQLKQASRKEITGIFRFVFMNKKKMASGRG